MSLDPKALVFHCLIAYPDSRVKETNPYLRDSGLLSLRSSPSMGGGCKVGNVARCGLLPRPAHFAKGHDLPPSTAPTFASMSKKAMQRLGCL
jgi:hypothetical protein